MNFYQQKLQEKRPILAPMAGFSDAPFRKLCRDFGSAWAVTEMVSAKGLITGEIKGIEIGEPYPNEPDLVIQVFGGEPEIVAEGGAIVEELYRPKAIDLNMGCPVKKVTGKSCGSKLMQDPQRAAEIVSSLKKTVHVPVSAKMRLGYDEVNVLEVAKALEEAGADLITIHGRTALQKYQGMADWESILATKEQLSIPVVGSGDVKNAQDFKRYSEAGLGVMVGRAALGRPWVFAELLGAKSPDVTAIAATALKHAYLHINWYGGTRALDEVRKASEDELVRENLAIRHFRAQLLRYFTFLDDEIKKALSQVESLSEIESIIQENFPVDVITIRQTVGNNLRRERPLKGKKRKATWKQRQQDASV
ncbi:MAG: tRNA-dihydrouridine synthase family protein [Deinococcales bacterium]